MNIFYTGKVTQNGIDLLRSISGHEASVVHQRYWIEGGPSVLLDFFQSKSLAPKETTWWRNEYCSTVSNRSLSSKKMPLLHYPIRIEQYVPRKKVVNAYS